MDPFAKLSPELRVAVMLSIQTGQDLLSFSHASPTIFHQFQLSRPTIRQAYINPRLQGSLVQDALAVATFPKLSCNKHRLAAIELHLNRWGSKQLPDPSEHPLALSAVSSLMDRVQMYMGDYVAKATSSDLSIAYRKLPHTQSTFDSSTDGGHMPACLNMLTSSEWERLARGFFRHELLCKVVQFERCLEGESLVIFQISWEGLRKYEGICSHRDIEMMECVHEYLFTLFGALAYAMCLHRDRPREETNPPVSYLSDSSYPTGHIKPHIPRYIMSITYSPNARIYDLNIVLLEVLG
ncbi:hypothetical protein G7046_g3573 [Stylonectria norvegica]|nr:hypothetical protein G7046_g3573 [Stylonectria norvegica]